MNKAKLKSYAPQARKDFIAAVEARAHSLGLSEVGGALDIAPSEKKGDVTLIAGQAWPAKVHDQRQRLIKRMKKDGFAQTVEAVAYTWFNRFAALRYMEIHDYLDHGYRVLSSREGGLPEIIAHATDVAGTLPGLNAAQIADMKLAGNQDGELYRLLLVAQCNALSKAMPFLFEHIDDESELLLPGNLERTDSVVAKLVESIAEEDWSEVEVIGWLYQFYISEKKDAVIGKVVKSEDIPAATQLFTPNWIVQYLVQNSVGRLWLMANPGSTLKGAWRYYIEPAEQTPEVQAQLDALIQTRMAEDGGSLNPETITVLDPACGSGHILVEAYEVLKAIYLERGYQARAIPRLILEKNLFGLDIDDRAAQMAGFALMMKARADDRRLLDSPIKLNVLSLQESKGLELDEFDSHLKPFGISRALLAGLIDTFAHAKTFGSLIQIPAILDAGLHALADGIGKAMQSGDVFAQAAAQDLVPLVGQATVLAMKFDAVVANPPYMGSGYFDKTFKAGLSRNYKTKRSDLYAIFLERAFGFVGNSGLISMITRQDWMFTKSYAELRNYLCQTHTLGALAHLGAGAFEMLSGEVTQTAAFVLWKEQIPRYRILFVDCSRVKRDKESIFLTAERYARSFSNFPVRLEQPLLYHLVDEELNALACDESLSDVLTLREGIHSGDNTTFVRTWWEVSSGDTCVYAKSVDDLDKSGRRWVPYNKGGSTRKWYWGTDYVLRYDESSRKEMSSLSGHVRPSQNLYFSEGGTWSDVATKGFGVRFYPSGHLFADAGPVVIAKDIFSALGLMNSKPFVRLAQDVMPNLHFKCGTLQLMPYVVPALPEKSAKLAKQAVRVCMEIAATYEEQRTFEAHPLVSGTGSTLISKDFDSLLEKANQFNQSILDIETENNNAYALAFGLEKLTDWAATASDCYLFCPNRQSESSNFISYAIGCAMGRYSLDQPGLIYAHAGNVGFDVTRYKIFPADADGIVPITDELWFEDDATNRVREFVNAVWGAETIEENMDWLAESLGKKGTETPEETIRRYLSSSFYKDHLQTYKKRPIYWHFSSGKQGAFQALVYLHRYHEGTLARMRAEYVVPLTGKMQSRIEMLEKDRDAATSTAARSKLAKQIESLRKKHVELLAYDEKLRHYADMRIQLDLDDGVKVNYGKFGDLLAEVKTVTGGAGDD